MPNKYCNLSGPTKIKDDYTNINQGFTTVESDINTINTKHQKHTVGTAERHASHHIDNTSSVSGITVSSALDTLKGLIDNLNATFSTDVERINAINQAISEAFGADDELEASLLAVIAGVQSELTAHKSTDPTVHPANKISFDKTGSNLTSTLVEAVIKELNSKVDTNKTTGDTNLADHKASTTAHGSSSITNQSNVTGGKITDALNALKSSLDAIVANVTVDSEVILARNSAVKNKGYDTLDERLEATEKEVKSLLQPEYSTPVEATAGVIGLDSSVAEGQLNVGLLGNTRMNLVKSSNMNKDTNTDGVVDDFTLTFTGGANSGNTVLGIDDVQKITITNPSSEAEVTLSQDITASAGEVISFRVESKTVGNARIRILIRFFNGASFINQVVVQGYTTGISSYTEYKSENNIAPVNTTKVSVLVQGNALAGNSGSVWFKNAMLEKATSIGDYISTGTQSTLDMRVSSVGKNLFDKDNPNKIIGYNIASDGSYGGSPTVTTSAPIKVAVGKSYTKSNDGGGRIRLLDEILNVISVHESNTVTIPSGVAYLQFAYLTSNEDIVQLEYGTVATEYEPYVSNESFIHLDEPLRSVGSVKDEVTEDSEKIQRNGTRILQASDITGYDTSQTNIDWVVIDRTKLMGIYPQQAGVTPNKILIPNFSPCPVYENVDNTAYINTYMDSLSFSASMFLFVPKGTYTSLADAQTKISAQNLEIIYQLATPITTEIEGINQIQAYPNGTIYVDHAIKETLLSNGNSIAISNTNLPIKELESVTLRNTITDAITELKTSECTIASDKLSFSHASISSDMEVTFVYKYDASLSTLPTIRYSYPLNMAGSVESAMKLASANSEKIIEVEDRVSTLEYEFVKEDYTEELTNEVNVFSVGTGKDIANIIKDYNRKVVDGEVSLRLLGRMYVNATGSDGGCESIVGWATIYGSVTLDATYKTSGSNSLKATISQTGTQIYKDFISKITKEKYYLVSVDLKNNDATNVRLRVECNATTQIDVISDAVTGNKRAGVKVPKITGNPTYFYINIMPTGNIGTTINFDSLLITEISEDEYKNSTVDELVAKYPYIDGAKSVPPVRLTSKGKNLIDTNKLTLGLIHQTDGSIIASPNYKITPFIPIESFSTYVLSNFENPNTALYDANKKFVRTIGGASFTPTANEKYVRASTPLAKVNIFQLEKGTVATPYEPYIESESYFPAIGASLPNGVRDEVVGEGEKIQRANQININGSETWDVLGVGTNCIAFYNTSIQNANGFKKQDTNNHAITDAFQVKTYAELTGADTEGIAFASDGTTYFKILKSKLTTQDVAGVKTWLSANPIKCIYQLLTPVTKEFDSTPLYAYNQGTIIVEPYINEALKHDGTKITLPYAVSSIDEITDIDGTVISAYTLDATGKILTFTGVNNAYYRVKAPIRPEESTIPTIVHRAPLNRVINKRDLQRIDKVNQDQQFQIDQLALQVAQMMGV